MNKPLVSIIITTHNREKNVIRAINSALNQSYRNIEIIVVDDHSSDNTRECVTILTKKYTNLYYYILPELYCGACAARNYGIKQARGVYIAGLDDDDEFLPNRIEKMMAVMSEDLAFVCSASVICDENSRKKTICYFSTNRYISIYDLLWCNVVGNQVLVRKDFILQAKGFDVEMPCNQDWDMWTRMLKVKSKAMYLKEVLQIVHVDNRAPSITKLANRKVGLDKFYRKNKGDMTFWQKHFFYYREYRYKLRKYSFWMFLSCIRYFFYKIA